MASIESYQSCINALRASIETLKANNSVLLIARTPGTTSKINSPRDLDLVAGAVIIDSEGEVYMRTAGWAAESWCAATDSPRRRSPQEMYEHMREQASKGVMYRFLYDPELR